MTFLGYKPSTLILWVVLAIPALASLPQLFSGDARAFHGLLHPTGEWAARFMIIGMMASGLMLLFRGRQWPRWLVHHRRDIEVAAFLYAAAHTVVYLIDRGTLAKVIEALPRTEIWTGWLAMAIFIPLAITSNDAAQRWLKAGWKTLQRWSYPAAILVLIHWAALHDWGGWVGPVVNFAPLMGLWAYRLWYWYLRPRVPMATV
ncbi:MAG: ferric reductase-like transmembrane domain-containing protein [Tabrizicola sp.]